MLLIMSLYLDMPVLMLRLRRGISSIDHHPPIVVNSSSRCELRFRRFVLSYNVMYCLVNLILWRIKGISEELWQVLSLLAHLWFGDS